MHADLSITRIGMVLLLALPGAGAAADIGSSEAVSLLDRPMWVLEVSQQAYLMEREPLTFCVDPDWLPFEAIDEAGRYVGMGADFLALMEQRGALELELLITDSWSETLQRARDGDCDFLPLAMATPGREQYLTFSEPYLETPSVLATRSDGPYVRDIAAVTHQPLGIMKDFSFVEIYRQRYPDINLVEVDSYEQGIEGVIEGRLFGLLGNMASIRYAIRESGNGQVKINGRLEGDSRLSVAVRQDKPELLAIFQTLVASISAAERQVIINHWYGQTSGVAAADTQRLSMMWALLVLVSLSIVLLLYWGYRLRLLNRGLEATNQRLTHLNRTDALTGLFNRLHFDDCLAQAMTRAKRNNTRLSVAMIDLDHFKRLNDQYGHAFGDHCLKALSRIMKHMLQRGTEVVARYGGEEFVVLSEGSDAEAFVAQLAHFRREVAASRMCFGGNEAGLSVSIGVYTAIPRLNESAMRFLLKADVALYEAKAEGRNRLVDHSPR
ncbi:diguanylate cyclase (GGDEF)-like protein [Natronospira proteinivora]|uniref:diguanylate cyclase n=1 Tax=Natronospira proteinivora TaxID=1807133 RepID=A0ABT1G938_9GAMM|nr:diguanylate cyclase [Natronospira proteinivora]MCP1727815.1 diguanylate cyclase (GGDEF)-like protein [Natronospira proteinivora]